MKQIICILLREKLLVIVHYVSKNFQEKSVYLTLIPLNLLPDFENFNIYTPIQNYIYIMSSNPFGNCLIRHKKRN